VTVFLGPVERCFSVPADFLATVARSLGQDWPQATGEVPSAFAPTGHTTRCRARLSGLQDAECDRRSAHVTKASRHRRHVLAHAGSDAQEISEFVVPRQ